MFVAINQYRLDEFFKSFNYTNESKSPFDCTLSEKDMYQFNVRPDENIKNLV